MVFFSLTPLAFPLLLWESKPAALRGGRRASCRAARPPPAPLAPAAEPRRSGTYRGERRGSPGETLYPNGVENRDRAEGSEGEWKVM